MKSGGKQFDKTESELESTVDGELKELWSMDDK